MNIYFNASMHALPEYGDNYKKIIAVLEAMGHKVIADHIVGYGLEKRNNESEEERNKYYHKMIKRIKGCDLMVAEISYPSTVHVGHELTLALEFNKPVLALYEGGKKPILFWGANIDERFCAAEYSASTLKKVIQESLAYLNDHRDVRFNFFISPEHVNYLDWIAKNRRIPRSVYLRRLIEADMKANPKYQIA